MMQNKERTSIFFSLKKKKKSKHQQFTVLAYLVFLLVHFKIKIKLTLFLIKWKTLKGKIY